MAAIDFPDSPTLNQSVTVGEKTWTWNGSYWVSSGVAAVGGAGIPDILLLMGE